MSPLDGSVWGTSLGYPGAVVRVDPGPDPTHTALTEVYEPPFPGYGPRGGDIDRDGSIDLAAACSDGIYVRLGEGAGRLVVGVPVQDVRPGRLRTIAAGGRGYES